MVKISISILDYFALKMMFAAFFLNAKVIYSL